MMEEEANNKLMVFQHNCGIEPRMNEIWVYWECAHISTAQRIICWNLMTRRKVKSCLKACSLAPFFKKNGGYGSKTTRPQNNPEVDGFTAETFWNQPTLWIDLTWSSLPRESNRNFCDVVYRRTWVCYPEHALKNLTSGNSHEIPMSSCEIYMKSP